MRQPVRLRLVIASLLIAASAIPNLGFEINTFGFYWTFYRIVVVFLALITLILYRGEVKITARKEGLLWMGFLLVWLVYGAVLLVASPYSDMNRGTLELFSVLCGLLSFFILSRLKLTDREIEGIFKVVFFILLGLILLGFYEIITANHLSTSMFNDPENRVAYRVDPHSASGIMYNINDFSALITLMCPAVIGRFRMKLRRGYFDPGWLLVAAVIVINRVNDANTCNIAIIVGVLLYFILPLMGNRRTMGRVMLFFAIIAVAGILFFALKEGEDGGIVARVFGLVKDTTEGQGSLHSRILIYRDAFAATWKTGLLGLGPAGFPVYYTMYPSDSNFINPHSLVLEILSQYGIIICLGFLFLLGRLIVRMYRIFKGEALLAAGQETGAAESAEGENAADTELPEVHDKRKEWGRLGLILVVDYFIVSFASSSYLLNTLHWTLLAVLALISDIERERGI